MRGERSAVAVQRGRAKAVAQLESCEERHEDC